MSVVLTCIFCSQLENAFRVIPHSAEKLFDNLGYFKKQWICKTPFVFIRRFKSYIFSDIKAAFPHWNNFSRLLFQQATWTTRKPFNPIFSTFISILQLCLFSRIPRHKAVYHLRAIGLWWLRCFYIRPCTKLRDCAPKNISFSNRRILGERIQIPSALFLDGVSAQPSSVGRGVMAVVVVNKIEFGIVELGRPLEGLGDVARRGNGSEGRVVVARGNALRSGIILRSRVGRKRRDAASPIRASFPPRDSCNFGFHLSSFPCADADAAAHFVFSSFVHSRATNFENAFQIPSSRRRRIQVVLSPPRLPVRRTPQRFSIALP